MYWFIIPMCLCCLSSYRVLASSDTYYTAAVYEHVRFGELGNDSAQLIVETNLQYYKRATEIARSKGADIIVFPEYGIFPPAQREILKDFLEDIPDGRDNINPCESADVFSDRPILLALSCLARNNSMFLVANMGDIQNCNGQLDCPPDGHFHFNTNAVFNREGTLVLKYHKEHLFFETGMDLAREQQDATFRTDFGIFATYVCWDIVFGRIRDVAQWPNVTGIAFTTMWFEQMPQWASVQLWQSWSVGNNVTFLASNIQLPGALALGSGIFDGSSGASAYTYDPDGISKLVVSRVPRRGQNIQDLESSVTAITDEGSWDWKGDGDHVKAECSSKLFNDTTDIYTDYRCIEEKTGNYSFVQLKDASGFVESCNNGMCCSLNYSTTALTADYYLGVFNGTQNSYNRYYWCEENCVLAVCGAIGSKKCATFPRRSDTVFQYISLRGNFTTSSVYPTIVESRMRLVPKNEWEYHQYHDKAHEGSLSFSNVHGRNIVTAGLKGRCYNKDPPYVR